MARTSATPRRGAMRRRRAAAVAGLIAAAMTPALAPAAATASSVSPGDEINHIESNGSNRCTLGYTFTRPGGTTLGITAGHCNATPGKYVLDRTTGATGRFIVTVHQELAPFEDYGVIDFGANRSMPVMRGMRVAGAGFPDTTNAVCHTGIASGVSCGQIAGMETQLRYLTTGISGIPGDSGGPVWQLNSDTSATIVGIWIGEHINDDGTHNGVFISLVDVMAQLEIDSAANS